MWKREKKPIVGVFGFSGCAGDQLAILHMEDELVDFFTSADIKFFHMAQSHQEVDHVDIALVEGSINTERQLKEIKNIREKSDVVVAIGTCACYGGIQFLGEDFKTFKERLNLVYGNSKFSDLVGQPRSAEPISKYIDVDISIPGCPIAKENFIPIYTKIINGLRPEKYPFPVCVECKYQGNDCFLLHGIPCLGPVTAAGCNACCPSQGVGCVGCFGFYEGANYKSMIEKLVEIGLSEDDAKRKLKMYGGNIVAQVLKGDE